MTSSRMRRSEGDNASEVNLGIGGLCAEGGDGAEVIGATVVELVVKGVGGGTIN